MQDFSELMAWVREGTGHIMGIKAAELIDWLMENRRQYTDRTAYPGPNESVTPLLVALRGLLNTLDVK